MRIQNFNHVFHPSDFTSGDEAAFTHALRIALEARGQLQLLHVKEPEDDVRWSDFPRVRRVLAEWGMLPAEATAEQVTQLGVRILKAQRADRDPVRAIARYVAEHRPDLVVLATHQRHGLDRLLHKPVAESIARAARAVTLFVPRGVSGFVNERTGEIRLRNILVPVDHSPNPQAAADAAAGLARALGCGEVHFIFLYAGKDGDMPRVNLPEQPGWTSERRTWDGAVVDHILSAAVADEADLIVMATHGHDGFLDAIRGSTTERVLHETCCPLLAVPA
jgi:nucleotide-binding universal stress UspA family protein